MGTTHLYTLMSSRNVTFGFVLVAVALTQPAVRRKVARGLRKLSRFIEPAVADMPTPMWTEEEEDPLELHKERAEQDPGAEEAAPKSRRRSLKEFQTSN